MQQNEEEKIAARIVFSERRRTALTSREVAVENSAVEHLHVGSARTKTTNQIPMGTRRAARSHPEARESTAPKMRRTARENRRENPRREEQSTEQK
ncbi:MULTISPECIES: hypothetical protein [unclassified Actinopolyspora]|uniref:hypothetical protein n=1 Tax=unclassified Actinopolyspora TaxID=2639451 RepID=UPI0013F677F9|nr:MULTISPECIES: hypothetical protein [unclassified Actinopolyspora]NHD16050.1 hypothetical protein [Actinopolyspora sp. BKK2]NHE74736.1 hypothetical protein [Actinopolyspora sp. BKK1]